MAFLVKHFLGAVSCRNSLCSTPNTDYDDIENWIFERGTRMYQFLVLASFTDHARADAVCGVLEEMKIPVMLEHIEINRDQSNASVIRVMVPSQFVQRASAIIHTFEAPRVANLH